MRRLLTEVAAGEGSGVRPAGAHAAYGSLRLDDWSGPGPAHWGLERGRAHVLTNASRGATAVRPDRVRAGTAAAGLEDLPQVTDRFGGLGESGRCRPAHAYRNTCLR